MAAIALPKPRIHIFRDDPDQYPVDPCGVGFAKSGIIWTNVYARNAVPPASTACIITPEPVEERFVTRGDILTVQLLACVKLSSLEKERHVVKIGKSHTLGLFAEAENILMRVPWWRRIMTAWKPLRLTGYRYDVKRGVLEVYEIIVRWLPRRKIMIRKVAEYSSRR